MIADRRAVSYLTNFLRASGLFLTLSLAIPCNLADDHDLSRAGYVIEEERMCLYCLSPDCADGTARSGVSRRTILRHATAIGAALPFVATTPRTMFAAERSSPAPADFRKDIDDLIARSHSPELAGYRPFEIDGSDLPWTDLGLKVAKGQQITFLVTGRMWLSRQSDLWFGAGSVFHARTHGRRPIYSQGGDTGTMIAANDGPVEVARLIPLIADDDGWLKIPEDVYRKADVKITGVALLWRGDAVAGLAGLAAHGDVGGLLAAEIERLRRDRKLPNGWSEVSLFGGGEESFNRAENGEIVCESLGSASIIERVLPIPFRSRPKLGWRWNIEQLPSAVAEDQAATHDYLSVGVKFEDGQDLTYLWSATLPKGKVFRCPLAGWDKIESHLVVDSGTKDLGTWRDAERDLAADYAAHIGGPAKAVSHVWLLAVSCFQRRRGACRYANIRVATADGATRHL